MSDYHIQILTYPRRAPLSPLHRAAVYQGSRHIATTAHAYESNAGCGMAAAIGEAQEIISGLKARSFFDQSADLQNADIPALTSGNVRNWTVKLAAAITIVWSLLVWRIVQ